jgi:hypothetical protein
MTLRSLGLIAMLVTSPAYGDEAMTVAQDLARKISLESSYEGATV